MTKRAFVIMPLPVIFLIWVMLGCPAAETQPVSLSKVRPRKRRSQGCNCGSSSMVRRGQVTPLASDYGRTTCMRCELEGSLAHSIKNKWHLWYLIFSHWWLICTGSTYFLFRCYKMSRKWVNEIHVIWRYVASEKIIHNFFEIIIMHKICFTAIIPINPLWKSLWGGLYYVSRYTWVLLNLIRMNAVWSWSAERRVQVVRPVKVIIAETGRYI